MTKPQLNFVWIGPPRFNNGGLDVIGPETFDQNFKYFAENESKDEPNPMVFWCQKAYLANYQEYFASKKIKIEVKSVEDYIEIFQTENEAAEKVREIFYALTLEQPISSLNCQYLKCIFFHVLLANEGNYVLDTNIQVIDPIQPIHFPSYDKYMFPCVTGTAEAWMQYAPPTDLTRAKKVLNQYLYLYDKALDVLKNNQEIEANDLIGEVTIFAMCLSSEIGKDNYTHLSDCAIWDCVGDPNTQVIISELNIEKEYYNTHKKNREHALPVPHDHVYTGSVLKLIFDLDHHINPDLTANPTFDVEKELPFQAENMTLLHLAMYYASFQKHRECAKVLLQRGADPNREHAFYLKPESEEMKMSTSWHIKTPLIYAIESGSESVVKMLFEYSQCEIFLMSKDIKPSSINRLYLYKNHSDYICYHDINGNEILLEEKEGPLSHALKKLDFNSQNHLTKLDNTKIINAVLAITSKRGHTRRSQPIEINKQINGKTPLIISLENNGVGIKTLLNNGADPNLLSLSATETISPLYLAVMMRQPKLVEYLLTMGANPNVGISQNTDTFQTRILPLHAALKNHDDEIVNLLMLKKANPHLVSEFRDKKTSITITEKTQDIETSPICINVLDQYLVPAPKETAPRYYGGQS